MPPSLSMTPPAATLIGGDLSLQTCEGWTTYFANLVPIDRHAAEDVRAGQIRMARLHLVSGIRQEDVAHAFAVGENFLWRKCDNPGVSIIWFSYNTFFNVRSQLSQPDLDWNRQNSRNSDATWCK